MTAFIKLFWQEDCIRCVSAKEVCNKLIKKNVPVKVKLYDISTIDGMTEAAFHEVITTPTTVIVDEDENEIKSWRGEAPTVNDMEDNLNVLIK